MYTFFIVPIIISFNLSCGYKIVKKDDIKGLIGKNLSLFSIKNLTSEYGIEQDISRILINRFSRNGVKISIDDEKADYKVEIVIKSIQLQPLSYRQGINVAYTYEYQIQISTEFTFTDTKSGNKKVFSITDQNIYFSADSPATTESNKKIAIEKLLIKITDRFIRELSVGIQGL